MTMLIWRIIRTIVSGIQTALLISLYALFNIGNLSAATTDSIAVDLKVTNVTLEGGAYLYLGEPFELSCTHILEASENIRWRPTLKYYFSTDPYALLEDMDELGSDVSSLGMGVFEEEESEMITLSENTPEGNGYLFIVSDPDSTYSFLENPENNIVRVAVNVSGTTDIEEDEEFVQQELELVVSAYPNPAKNGSDVKIEVTANSESTNVTKSRQQYVSQHNEIAGINIFNVKGELIKNVKPTIRENLGLIQTSGLSSGNYFYAVTLASGKTLMRKLIVCK